jgi:hypothetical protein
MEHLGLLSTVANDLSDPLIFPCSVSAAGGLLEAGEGETSEVLHTRYTLRLRGFPTLFYTQNPHPKHLNLPLNWPQCMSI